MKLRLEGEAFRRVAVDILGPLPETDRGNKYIAVVGDYFTKWCEAYPLPNQEATTVADALVSQWVCRYGVPAELHSDQGRNFEARLFKQTCQLLGIHKTRTTPLHPESDGMVERFNRTLCNCLAKMVDEDHQGDWDQQINYVMMAYRSSVHETTGFSPSYLLFGRELRLPGDLICPTPETNVQLPCDYVADLKSRLERTHEFARENLRRNARSMKERYDGSARREQFNDGDQVWVYWPKRKRGISPKLQSPWSGPHVIKKVINDQLCEVSIGRKTSVLHRNRLSRYRGSQREVLRDEELLEGGSVTMLQCNDS